MNRIVEEVLAANEAYAAAFGDKANLPLPPGRRFAVLTCMDARLDPAKFAGLREGDAHVFRNAGGRVTDDAIRSLVVSYKLLGTEDWFVIHHTDCGMQYATDADIARLLATSRRAAAWDGAGWRDEADGSGTTDGEFVRWLTIADPAAALRADLRRLRDHPLVPPWVRIHGYIYDVKTGRLTALPAALQEAGHVVEGS
jgi:carbonic anhydrase